MTKYNTSKQDNIEIYKLNIQEQEALTKKYEIKGVPTLLYLENGKVLGKQLGVRSVEQLKNYEKEYFSNSAVK